MAVGAAHRCCERRSLSAGGHGDHYLRKRGLLARQGMTPLGWTHSATAAFALASGAAVLLATKGTRRHRQLGWVYVTSMVALNGTALLIYRLFGGFGPFHAFAILSLITVVAGAAAAVQARRFRGIRALDSRTRALERHYAWMTWSYVGLVAAALSEGATRLPLFRPQPGAGLGFGIGVGVATIVVVAVGAQLIRTRRDELLAPFRASKQMVPRVRSV
jgi:uncharacterized membrane protein